MGSTKMKSFVVVLTATLLLVCCVNADPEVIDEDAETKDCDYANCGSSCPTNCNNCDCNCQSQCTSPCVTRCRGCSSRGSRCKPSAPHVVLPTPSAPIIIRVPYEEPTRSSASESASTNSDIKNNVTTIFESTSVVSNNNTIHIPVSESHTHHSDIHIIPSKQPSIYINISSGNPTPTLIHQYIPPHIPPTKEIEFVTVPSSSKQESQNQTCCTIVPPKECNYDKNEQINCTQTAHKICGSICTSPLIIQHTYLPTYIPFSVPDPHTVPVYNPVNPIQRILFPQPVPVYYPVTQIKHIPVPLPEPVPQYVPYVQRVPVPTPCQQQPSINLYQESIFNTRVQQPSLCQVQTQQQIPQRIPQQPGIHYYQHQPQVQHSCPVSSWNGKQYPICRRVEDTRQFVGTNRRFILDQWNLGLNNKIETTCKTMGQYPWVQCNKQALKDCNNCVYCGGAYNPQKCMYSQNCNSECHKAMTELNLPQQMGRMLKCQMLNASVKCT